jgi:hypothetical protein
MPQENDTENYLMGARSAPLLPVLDWSAQVDRETLSKTLRAVADVLDGCELREPSPPPLSGQVCACGSFSAAELAALARRYLRHRRERERLLPDLFADPAWDILLDLFAASIERRPVSISSACVAAAVSPTTALRWIGTLEARGLVLRVADTADRRRTHLRLAESAEAAIIRWLERLAQLCDPGTQRPARAPALAGALRIPPPS